MNLLVFLGAHKMASSAEEEVNRILLLPLRFEPRNPQHEDFLLACKILEIDKDSLTSPSISVDIKKKSINVEYRKKAFSTHPDKHQQNSDIQIKAQNAFHSVGAAQQLLLYAIDHLDLYTSVTPPVKFNLATVITELMEVVAKYQAYLDSQIPHASDESYQVPYASDESYKENLAAEQERMKQVYDCGLLVALFRNYLSNIIPRSEENYSYISGDINQVTLDIHQEFKGVNPEQLAPVIEELSFFFGESAEDSYALVKRLAKENKLLSLADYQLKEEKLKTLFFEIQCMALCDAAFGHIQHVLAPALGVDKNVSMSTEKTLPDTFKTFVQAFTGNDKYTFDAGVELILPSLDKYMKQNSQMVAKTMRFAEMMREKFGENLSELNIRLEEVINHFMTPKYNISIMQMMDPKNHFDSLSSKLRILNTGLMSLQKQELLTGFSTLGPKKTTGLAPEKSQTPDQDITSVSSMQSQTPDQEITSVSSLKEKLNHALAEYIDYSKTNCRFSLFHRHGELGRKRAQSFIDKICKESNLDVMQKEILDFLKDKNNGNTHPHSFRAMLLAEIQGASVNDFQSQLAFLENKWVFSQPRPS